MSKPPTKKPDYTVRYGRILGSCWRQTGGPKGDWFSVTIRRSYPDGKGKLRLADSFGVDDLLVVAQVAQQCWWWCQQQLPSPASDQADTTQEENP